MSRPGARARRAPLVLLLGATLVAGACTSGDAPLTIYSGREEELVGSLLERFAQRSGVDIEVRYGDSTDLALLISEEGDNSPADVFLSQSPGSVEYLDDEGLLSPLPEAELSRVRAGFRASDGRWLGLTARQRVLVYNPDIVSRDELPDSVFDLTDPRYRSKVALAPTNASFQDFVTAMREVEGEDAARAWLEGMVANESPTYADNLSIVDAVAREEVPMGLVNHYYNYRYLDVNPGARSRNYVFPGNDIGALLIASTVSVLQSADDEDVARRFVDFLLSDDAGTYFARETFEYPLVRGIEPSSELPPFSSLDAPDFDLDQLGGGLRETTKLISDTGLL